MVDTDGDPLRRAVRAEPDVISPNVLEAEELVGHEFNDDEDHVFAVREMVELGAREAIMTTPDGCFALMAPEEPGAAARSTACGSRTARSSRGHRRLRRRLPGRLRRRRYAGRSPVECLAYGVACGAESTQHLGAGVVDPEQVGRLLDEIEVERPALPAEVG